MKLHRTLNPGFAPLLLLPVVDLAAALLIFLLLSGGILLQPGISVQAPDSPFLLAPQRDPRVVAITGAPRPGIYFDNQRLDAAGLARKLKSLPGSTRTLIIKADERAPVELLVEVTNVAISQGFTVALATTAAP